jgi:hypothetical protein
LRQESFPYVCHEPVLRLCCWSADNRFSNENLRRRTSRQAHLKRRWHDDGVGLALAVDGVDIPGARTERDKGLVRSHPGHAACSRKQTACFSTFPYVCPEPVLANKFGFDYRVGGWHFYIKMIIFAKTGSGQT